MMVQELVQLMPHSPAWRDGEVDRGVLWARLNSGHLNWVMSIIERVLGKLGVVEVDLVI
jgi:hypothetical protein